MTEQEKPCENTIKKISEFSASKKKHIDRALIIRREQVKISQLYAEECAKSCEEQGLPYEFITAVEFMERDDAFASVGVKVKGNYRNTMGNICCHSSHVKCWQRIIEIDRPCIILEHDALIVGDVQSVEIPDMAVVTFGHRVSNRNDYSPPSKPTGLVEINRAVGVHACGLSPVTAKWLFEDARDNGIGIGVDRWLMMSKASGLPLYVCEPPQAVCWVRLSTSNFKPSEANREEDLKGHRTSVHNYKEALTPGWKRGLRI